MHNGSPSPSSFFSNGVDLLIDRLQLPDQLSFLNDDANASPELLSSPTGSYGGSATWGGSSMHRRSCLVNDACVNLDDGLGWRPCLYYARGFCKNESSCKFGHVGGVGYLGLPLDNVGSPRELMGQCHDLLRLKSAGAQQQQQQQRLAAPQIEVSHRLLNLQLLDVKKHHHQRDLSAGSPVPSPTHSPNLFNQTFGHPFPASLNAAEGSSLSW